MLWSWPASTRRYIPKHKLFMTIAVRISSSYKLAWCLYLQDVKNWTYQQLWGRKNLGPYLLTLPTRFNGHKTDVVSDSAYNSAIYSERRSACCLAFIAMSSCQRSCLQYTAKAGKHQRADNRCDISLSTQTTPNIYFSVPPIHTLNHSPSIYIFFCIFILYTRLVSMYHGKTRECYSCYNIQI
jgi:hypothetical protein